MACILTTNAMHEGVTMNRRQIGEKQKAPRHHLCFLMQSCSFIKAMLPAMAQEGKHDVCKR